MIFPQNPIWPSVFGEVAMADVLAKCTIRAYRPGDEEEIVQLLGSVFNRWRILQRSRSGIDHWRWRYRLNPLGPGEVTVATRAERIMGCYHASPLRIKIGSKVYKGAYTGDAAVHADLRRMGLGKKIIAYNMRTRKESGLQLSYFVTANRGIWSVADSILRGAKLGLTELYRRFPPIRVWTRIDDLDRHLVRAPNRHAFLRKHGFHLVQWVHRFKSHRRQSRPSSPPGSIREITRFDGRIDRFWQDVREGCTFSIERGRDHLNWRYFDSRAGDYSAMIAEGEDRSITGYAVLGLDKRATDYPQGYIMDLVSLPGRLDVADSLIRSAVDSFKKKQVNIIRSLALKNYPYEALLEGNGFVPRRDRVPVYYMPYEPIADLAGLEMGSPDGIHFSYGDLDLI
jgi:hypothetical protein